jgi:FMN phosphatase YigB (HAD superfamily)
MNKKLLVCDLDNTLYDWVAYFVSSFYAMVDQVVQITGCDRNMLLDDFRLVHQKHHDSEHPFALLETNTIKNIYKDDDWTTIARKVDPALHAFNSARKQNLQIHPGVRETLTILRQKGIKLVAHTESKLYGAVDRLDRLGLFEFFSRIYCRERSVSLHPFNRDSNDWLRRFPMEKITELSFHQIKPNPTILLEICAAEEVPPREAVYVGDSIARDVLMARRANVYAIWAAYGAEHRPAMYEALVRISHWTMEEVERERLLREEAKSIKPDFIAHREFSEVLNVFGLSH